MCIVCYFLLRKYKDSRKYTLMSRKKTKSFELLNTFIFLRLENQVLSLTPLHMSAIQNGTGKSLGQ